MTYDYIERFYGIRFEPGMRVLFTEYDDLSGTVQEPEPPFHYVTVKFDDGTSGPCHPDSLKIITEHPAEAGKADRPPRTIARPRGGVERSETAVSEKS